jgi:hypothetical protein
MWCKDNFRNMSVKLLYQMWSSILIDKKIRQKLGIHRTSRTLVRYIVEQIEFKQSGDDKRIIFEPCSGSAAFLVGAMNRLRPTLFGMPPPERHQYFKKRLVGIEHDPFGVEISKLLLTLADFPNGGGWQINHGDVFHEGSLTHHLQQAGVVLCNPPFGDFEGDERPSYNLTSTHKPVEILHRILRDLHPSGVIGFVLPRNISDGRAYKRIRAELAKRFGSINLTVLPDRAFDDADTEPALLVAKEPIPHNKSRLVFSKVGDSETEWNRFQFLHEVSSRFEADVTPSQAFEGLFIPELPGVWEYLKPNPVLDDIAEVYRGIQWNKPLTTDDSAETGNREKLVRERPVNGFHLGIAPKAKFGAFETPAMSFLSHRSEDQGNLRYLRPWDKPKAILNKSAKSRQHWRIAAFPDSVGVSCYQTFIAVWPTSDKWDEILLAALLNSPLANAFVASREGKTDVTVEILKQLPVPIFTSHQREKLREMVGSYQQISAQPDLFSGVSNGDPERLLMEIDALVLDGYKLPPRLEHEVLAYFQGHNYKRPTSHAFSDYLPPGQESYFSLSTHLSPKFQRATTAAMLEYFDTP